MDYFEFNIGNGSFRSIRIDTVESVELKLNVEIFDDEKRKMVKGHEVTVICFSGNEYIQIYDTIEEAQSIYEEIFNLIDAYRYAGEVVYEKEEN